MVSLLKKANGKTGRKIHRWVGVVVAVYVLMATASGIVHIVMANFFAAPPAIMPQGFLDLDKASLPLAEITRQIPKRGDARAVTLRTINNELWYQVVKTDGLPTYINAANGKIGEGLDERYAQQIAQDFLNSQQVEKTDYLRGFSEEYLNIFRALPVYRFDAVGNKGERVYVSTITGSVTHYLNNPRALGQYSFTYLHKLGFIHDHKVKDFVQFVLLTGIIFTTIMGMLIFFGRKSHR